MNVAKYWKDETNVVCTGMYPPPIPAVAQLPVPLFAPGATSFCKLGFAIPPVRFLAAGKGAGAALGESRGQSSDAALALVEADEEATSLPASRPSPTVDAAVEVEAVGMKEVIFSIISAHFSLSIVTSEWRSLFSTCMTPTSSRSWEMMVSRDEISSSRVVMYSARSQNSLLGSDPSRPPGKREKKQGK